ncbi:MAG: cytochrome c biogenesis protein ResB [Aquificaceae bacterium]
MFRSYAFLIFSSLLFVGTAVYGLFYLEERGWPYYTLLGVSGIFSFLSIASFVTTVIKSIGEDYRKHKDLFSFLYDFFSSLKLAIFLMLALGVLSMLGSTYIQQNQPITFYLDMYGVDLGLWFWKLWLTDAFHSWYYIALIVLLAINLSVCSIKRLPKVWVHTFTRERFQKLDEHMERHIKPLAIEVNPSKEKILALLKRMGFSTFVEEERNRVYFYAEKGRYSRLGVYIVHLGLLVVMAGALMDALLGVRGVLIVPEGSRSDVLIIPSKGEEIKLPFQVKLENFRIVTYGEEARRKGENTKGPFEDATASYESSIKVIKNEKVISSGVVAVNSPFNFGVYRVFQASYGLTGEAGEVRLIVIDREKATKDPKKAIVGETKIEAGKVTEFQNMLLSIERSTLNIEDEQAGMKGDLKPAVMIKVLLDRKPYNVPVVYSPELTLLAYTKMKELENFPYVFFMSDFKPRFFSGFQISKQPGTSVVWLGSLLIVVGMLLAFYTVHRKVWMRLEGSTLKVAFWSHKFKEEFRKDLFKGLEELR